MSKHRMAWAAGVALLTAFTVSQGPIAATEGTENFESGECISTELISIPVDTSFRDDEGSLRTIATESVPSSLQGLEAEATIVGENNSSVHPGNNLIIASGSDSIVLEDIEAHSGKTTTSTERLTLGSEISITVEMGEDEQFSGGGTVQVEVCKPAPVETTTTTEAPTTSTTVVNYQVCEDIAALKLLLDDVVRDDEGTIHVLASVDIPEAVRGEKAEVVFVGANNGSVHPGSNLTLVSGDTTIVLEDVEGSNGKITEATETLTLGDKLEITVQIGEDNVFSGGGEVVIQVICEEPPATTTTSTEPPATTTTTTEPPTTTTTEPPATTTTTEVEVEVLPEVIERPLAKTGVNTYQIASFGALLLLLGTGLASAARQMRNRWV